MCFGAAAVLLVFLHLNNERDQDSQPACCNVRTVRLLRSAVFCSALSSCMVALWTRVQPWSERYALIVLILLWVFIFVYFAALILLPAHYEPRCA